MRAQRLPRPPGRYHGDRGEDDEHSGVAAQQVGQAASTNRPSAVVSMIGADNCLVDCFDPMDLSAGEDRLCDVAHPRITNRIGS